MPKVAVAYFVARIIGAHEMTLKLHKNGVRTLEITLVWHDATLYDFFNVEDV